MGLLNLTQTRTIQHLHRRLEPAVLVRNPCDRTQIVLLLRGSTDTFKFSLPLLARPVPKRWRPPLIASAAQHLAQWLLARYRSYHPSMPLA